MLLGYLLMDYLKKIDTFYDKKFSKIFPKPMPWRHPLNFPNFVSRIYYYIINSLRNKILDWYGFKYSLKKIDMGSN